MKNFAEEIAYWYFRLNGFFLIENYVSHHSENLSGTGQRTNHADNDLLGIRPSNVKEGVGIRSNSDLCERLEQLLNGSNCTLIGIICEVKGAENWAGQISGSRLPSCVRRLGIIADDILRECELALGETHLFNFNGVGLYKIFAGMASSTPPDGWFPITIEQMLAFVETRLANYDEKTRAWNHYDSPLMQYLLYRHRQNSR
ncbi:hypothetical protein [Hymenobacter rubidus]|uniref:hypothetical protein n=1 Tax=Hymenobacter rubidus TaxID=1441626 RepID=UPI00191FD368|nr:hypothetical protein [Hymenobacter rubidus]